MSADALELLRALSLLDNQDRVADLSRMSDTDILGKVNFYMQSRRRSIAGGAGKAGGEKELSAWISSLSSGHVVKNLLPATLAFGKLQVNDLMFKVSPKINTLTVAMQEAGLVAKPITLNRVALLNALNHFSALAPLIRIGAVETLPMDLLHEGPNEAPIYYSKDGFASQIPPHLYKYIHDSAVVHEVRPGPGGRGYELTFRVPKKPVRGIAVQFDNDDNLNHANIYTYWSIKSAKPAGDHLLELQNTMEWDKPLSKEEYAAWVSQTINQVALRRMRELGDEARRAEEMGSLYLTPSGFEAGLCGRSVQGNADVAVNFLQANSTELRIDSATQIARLRSDDPKRFERFRQTLYAVAAELRDFEGDFQSQAQVLFEREIRPQVDEIRDSLDKAIATGAKGAILAAASVGLAVISGGNIPLVSLLGFGTAAAVGEALTEAQEYVSARQRPAFVWSKMTK
ncbi:MAG TPA: hypothetical protein VGP72_05510 [Planctomycetota bacterium]|jgi:hypothetical protein